MSEGEAADILSGMSSDAKRKILSELVSSLISGMSDIEKKEMIQSVLIGQKENRQLSSMVEH